MTFCTYSYSLWKQQFVSSCFQTYCNPPIPHPLINFWPQMGNELDQNTGVSRLIYKMITRICLHLYSNLKEFERICGNWGSFKNDEKWFLFHLKSTFCFWDISIFFRNFGHVGKQFDEKAKANFKIHDITHWITNNYNTRIAQHLKK